MLITPDDRSDKHIAFVVHSTKLLDSEPGLDRAAYIAELLSSSGYHVDVITSSFQHWKKAHRGIESQEFMNKPYNIVFMDEPGYKRNIDPMRIVSHHIFNKRLKKFLASQENYYDAVWCQMPPNNVASTAAKFAQRAGIPLIVDLNDLWPEAMRMVIDIPVISDIAFSPMAHDAKRTFNTAWGVIGTSNEYANHPNSYRKDDIANKLTVYVGMDLVRFDEGAASHAINKPEDEIWVAYAGTLGKSYDIATLIDAVNKICKKQVDSNEPKKVRLKILGDGPDRDTLVGVASKVGHDELIEFLGYKPYEEMAGYLVASDIVVNSLTESAPQSIVSKIADYLASGSALISTGKSQEMRTMCEREHIGISCNPGDVEALSDAISLLISDEQLCHEYGVNARRLAEKKFDRATAYLPIIDFVDKAVFENKQQ